MESTNHNILTLSIEQLLNGDHHYIIPVYQRNYAWQEGEITQLIQDIIDYVPKNESDDHDYYIGTLVTYERQNGYETVYETIDGQQRLTTLTLLLSTIRHFYQEIDLSWFKKINLEFQSRKAASETLRHIYIYGNSFSEAYEYNEDILNGYELCLTILSKKIKENNISISQFVNYLIKKVKILRVTVPEDTDLNHYFEIMNNRGEQLEKHEVLKSRLLEQLNALEESEKQQQQSTFNAVWEACSNMETYVQYGFNIEQRHAIFGRDDWNTLLADDFLELSQKLYSMWSDKGENNTAKLTDILDRTILRESNSHLDDAPERFNSVINFSNFLLHVLRIYTQKDIPLDDKRLISTFESEIKAADDKISFVQNFGYELLRCKMFFDKYIIKREFIGGIDRWSLKRLKWYPGNKVSYVNTFGNADNDFDEDNRSILMLLSMFHVSNPTLVYKHWLNGALNYVRSNGNFNEAIKYKLYLINLAKSFVFDRFLNKSAPLDYYEIIYRTNKDVKRNKKMLDENKLRYGAIENNLIFNYLDYLLWEKYNQEKEIKKYEFSFRSSVEHYYPRHPMPGYKKLNDDCLDSFGNLCLISHSKNSRLNNQPPIAKCSHYKKQSLDSIKQWVMMNDYKPDDWGEVSISDHYEKMIKVLTGDMDSLYEDLITFGTEANTRNNNAEHWFDLYKNDTENKKILARALMCFGDIATDAGYSNYRESWHHKYYLYEWDKINTLPAFSQYQKYIKDYNPGSLSSLIKDNLENNKSLLKDPYRYAFVKYPEFWEYCDRGYFTWVDNGASILLHSGEKNTGNTSLDLIIFLLWKWVEKYYCNEVNYWREGIGVSIDINETFKFVERDGGKGKLFIHCEDYGKIKCYVQPNKNSANSSFVRLLGDFGWQNYEDRQYQKGNTSTIVMLTHDYEEDYNKAIEKLTLIFKNGLGIKI